MTGTLLLALALAQAAQPAGPADRIEIGVVQTFADGATRTVSSAPGRRLIYVSAKSSMCDAPGISGKQPEHGTFEAWKVEVEPAAGDARVVWRRLESAAAARGAKNGIRTLPTVGPVEWTALDHLDIPSASGCKAAHWSLVGRRSPSSATASQLVEAELWFLHKAPDGKETSQRQAVRIRNGGRGDFYFDDTPLTLAFKDYKVPIAVEVFGTINTGTMMGNGDINMTLSLTRRYINKDVAFGNWPKTGSTDYPMTVKAGEVVSFLLPPLKDDDGILLGHRFSLRLRLTPVKPGEN
ncbi:MAG TPA: hypothetical protein VFZ36_01260 [Vicinamibacterales bacterium]